MTLIDKLKARRLELGLSQTQLATRVSELRGGGTALTRQAIAQWEGGRDVGASVLEEWAAALGVTLELVPVEPLKAPDR